MKSDLTHETIIYIGGALGKIGDQWEELRRAGDDEAAKVALKHYHGLINFLMSTGWRGSIPPETELPDEHMPPHYLEMLQKVKADLIQELQSKGTIPGQS